MRFFEVSDIEHGAGEALIVIKPPISDVMAVAVGKALATLSDRVAIYEDTGRGISGVGYGDVLNPDHEVRLLVAAAISSCGVGAVLEPAIPKTGEVITPWQRFQHTGEH